MQSLACSCRLWFQWHFGFRGLHAVTSVCLKRVSIESVMPSNQLLLVLAGAAWGSRRRFSWADLLAVGWLGLGWDRVSTPCPPLPCCLWAGGEHPRLAGSRGFLDGTSCCSSALWPVPCTSSRVSGGWRAWGLRGGEACCGLLLWLGPSCWFFLPRSVSPGRKGDSQALMEGGCLPWLFIFGEAHRLSPLLVVPGWPDVARGSLVGSRGSWPSPNSLLSPD